MKTRFRARVWLATMVLVIMTALAAWGSEADVTAEQTKTAPVSTVKLNRSEVIVPVGITVPLKVEGSSAKVKWKSSNKKVAVVSKKGKVKIRKTGKAVITAKVAGKTLKCKVKVVSNKKYVKSFSKAWVKENLKGVTNPFYKALTISAYVGQAFSYGSTNSAKDVLIKGKGTCYSGSLLTVEMLKAAGFSAKVRFAAKDKMSRYPSGIYFAKQHYNVQVTINGKKYYVDGQPGRAFIYLSSETKPLYYGFFMQDGLWTLMNDLPAV